MIWFLALLYRVLRWIGEKAGLQFGGRLSAGARSRALGHVERGVAFEGVELSVPETPCTVRVACRFASRSSARIDIVGVNLRMGRSRTGGTFHRLTWSAETNGPLPVDLMVNGFAGGDGGRVAFDVSLPAVECLASDPDLWLDGSVRIRVRRAGRARFELGEFDAPVPSTRLALDADSLSRTERERLVASRSTLRERLARGDPESVVEMGEGE